MRSLKVAGHLLAGVFVLVFRFPRLGREAQETRMMDWARDLVALVGGKVRLTGRLPNPKAGGALIVANHVSWVDIHALHTVIPARFVAKSEVRDWPLIGWMASRSGTLFLDRARKADARRMGGEMAAFLGEGDCIALFPEGTTSEGRDVGPFFPFLLQPAIDAGVKVYPVAIRYADQQGGHNPAIAFHGEMTFMESLRNVLRERTFVIEMTFLPPVDAAGANRRELADQLREAIRAVLVADAPRTSPETADRLPVGTH